MSKNYLIYPKILKGREAINWQNLITITELQIQTQVPGNIVDGIIPYKPFKVYQNITRRAFKNQLRELGVEC